MKTELINVSPSLAREWLKRNSKNRPLRPSHVETLRLAFGRGEYVTTHQGIAFDTEGELVDGQHRLAALSTMDDSFSILMLVTWGLNRDRAFPVIDATQAKRSTSDVLRVERGVGETANFLARLYSGSFAGITPTYVQPFTKFLLPEINELLAFCPTNVRTWSSAPVRAAAVMQMKNGDADFVKLVYSSMIRRDFETMPRSAQALFKSHMTGSVRASAANDIFVRCLKVFDPANTNLSRIQIQDIGAHIENVRSYLDQSIFNDNKKKAPGKSLGANSAAYEPEFGPAVRRSQWLKKRGKA